MAVHWQIKFMSLVGKSYTVDIYDSSFSGTPVQLTGGDQPFVTREINDEDMYIPIRTQSGYLRFIVEDPAILTQIQPTLATDRPVVLRNVNNVEWVGFLQPEQYNQPWIAPKYEIEVPLMSIMSAMQSVDFTQAEGYVSFFSLVRTINSYVPFDIEITAPEETPVKDVYVQNNNFRSFLTIAERAERGTTNKYECTSIYDALEAFCQYFGFSLHEYKGSFFCVVYPDDNIHYIDIATDGSEQESQWGSVSMSWLTICGANNRQSHSNVYRRILGEFETGKEKMDNIYAMTNFFKQFSVKGYNSNSLLFNGNAEVQPYKNGVQKTEWISDGTTDSGGQIIRKQDVRLNTVQREGATWSDELIVFSQDSKVGSPETAIKLNIPNNIYLNYGEYAAINIDGSVMPWFDITQGEGFIKKLHCKLRIGEYWLNTIEQTGYLPRYEWTTTETSCYLIVDEGGGLTMIGAQYTLDIHAASEMEHISGFAIDMPSGLAAGYYDIYFELLANAEAAADFGTYSSIGYLIHGLTFRVLRGVNSVSQPTPNFDVNTISRTTNGNNLDDYTVSSTITTKRGVQYGTGAALDENHAYITTKYDEFGIVRRASVMNKFRELLTVSVRNHTQPIDGVTYHNQNYGILSQSIDWRDDTNSIRIINLE